MTRGQEEREGRTDRIMMAVSVMMMDRGKGMVNIEKGGRGMGLSTPISKIDFIYTDLYIFY